MKKSLNFLLLLLIIASALFIRCDCCINCPTGDIEFIQISPLEAETVYTSMVTLKWKTEFIHTTQGEIQALGYCKTDDMWEAPIPTISLTQYDSTFEIGPLEPSTSYSWQITASAGTYIDHYEQYFESFSPIWTFTTADILLEAGDIHTPAPDSGAVGVSINPTLSWVVHNPDLLPYDFNIYLGTTTDPPLLASGLSAPWYEYSSDTLEYATLYYWRAEAYYGADTIRGPLWNFTTDYPSDADVFALLEIDARLTASGYHLTEEVRMRLDTGLAIDTPMSPLEADSVFVNDIKLDWIVPSQSYNYIEWSLPFIINAQPVEIIVYGNSIVPDLNTSTIFPDCNLGIVSPESFNTVPITGFEVTWDGNNCDDVVWITLMRGNDSTGVWKETTNDGIETLTATDLLPLGGQTGSYNLIIMHQFEENIDAPGYLPESIIQIRLFNVMEQININ